MPILAVRESVQAADQVGWEVEGAELSPLQPMLLLMHGTGVSLLKIRDAVRVPFLILGILRAPFHTVALPLVTALTPPNGLFVNWKALSRHCTWGRSFVRPNAYSASLAAGPMDP